MANLRAIRRRIKGVQSTAKITQAMEMIAGFDYNSKTSMQLDRETGRQTEIDALTAYLCKAGKESGVATPLHDEIYFQLK